MSDTESVEVGRTSPVPGTGGRHEKSLGLLTSKFVDLLQGAEGGVLDLKKVKAQHERVSLSHTQLFIKILAHKGLVLKLSLYSVIAL